MPSCLKVNGVAIAWKLMSGEADEQAATVNVVSVFKEVWSVLLFMIVPFCCRDLRVSLGLGLSIGTLGQTFATVCRDQRCDRIHVDFFLLCQGLGDGPEFVLGESS